MKKLLAKIKNLQDNPSTDKKEQELREINMLIAELTDRLNNLNIKYTISIEPHE